MERLGNGDQDGRGSGAPRLRGTTNVDRKAAALRAKARGSAPGALPNTGSTAHVAPRPSILTTPRAPDYFGSPNWAYTPPLRKFIDSLPGLGAANKNTLGQYIPVATPDVTTFPGSDYYSIELKEYQQQLHRDLGLTTLRGYRDLNGPNTEDKANHYLGPLIVAQKGRPVRVKFKNALPTGTAGQLFLPMDDSFMGAGMGPVGGKYSENRANLHLHGGNTPWISDGTPHQWITPPGESSTPYLKGVSFQNVPDMVGQGKPIPSPQANDGMATYYWPNEQSGRLLFYHDHSYGITRLNVYAGEVAGYLIHDSVEDDLINRGILPKQGGGVYNWGIPLILQDKTFVGPTTLATDPTWVWGAATGSLWFPHVYMPNQNPADMSGSNQFGRWDYGMWFWPPLTASQINHPAVSCASLGLPYLPEVMCPGTRNPSGVPEAFGDTPLVNGQAYPYLNVARQAYRFRVLNGANDRAMNLQVYYAATPSGVVCRGNAAPAASCTEVSMVDAYKHYSVPRRGGDLPLCSASAMPDPVTGLPAGCWPTTWPTDGRDGGVPDPLTAGPQIYQIGTESGLLPKLVRIPSNPIDYEYGRRSITVLNVSTKSLFLMPAERADVVLDFSSVPDGSTLILYNDAPAPVPAFDTRNDFYTGDPDQSASGDNTGGAPTTAAGMGPNTRTIMQFRVSGGTAMPFNVSALEAALPAAYAQSQATPVVPEAVYNAAYKSSYTDNYARIQDTTMKYTDVGGAVPTIHQMEPKTIQELFEQDYGRMNATLGVELPLTNFNTQTTIPYGYIDPPTEIVQENTPQLWKITHNGVDTHGIHFHLFDVQVIDRVGWDGMIKPPDENEMGWKDTVRMNPLEDIVVALRPMKQTTPWPMPDSIRTMDVTMPENASMTIGTGMMGNAGFSGIAPDNNAAVPNLLNYKINFGQEFVWHCHILGHEENDMMRPVVKQIPVETPTDLKATQTGSRQVTLTFMDHSASETGFTILKSTNATLAGATMINLPPNQTTIVSTAGTQTTYVDEAVAQGTTYYYAVYATKNNVYNKVNSVTGITKVPVSAGNPLTQSANSNVASIAVVNLAAVPAITSTSVTGTSPNVSVTVNWTGPSGVTFTVQRATDSAFASPTTVASGLTTLTYANTGVSAGTYYYRIGAVSGGTTAWSQPVTVGPPAAPGNLSAALNTSPIGTLITLTWTDNSPTLNAPNYTSEANFTVVRTNVATNTSTSLQAPAHTGTGTMTFNDNAAAGTYTYQVRANNSLGSSALSNVAGPITR